MRIWLAASMVACTGGGTLDPNDHGSDDAPVDSDPPTDTDTDIEPADTGDTAPPVTDDPTTLTATCTLAPDNSLRALCEVSVEPPQAVEIVFSKTDGTGPERVHGSGDVFDDHLVDLYFMAPTTDYTWTARAPDAWDAPEVSGTLTTDSLPPDARVVFDVTGTSSAAMVGLTTPCAAPLVVVASTDGEVLWYQEFPVPGPFNGVEGVAFTEDGTVLALVAGGIVEVDMMGRELLHLTQGQDFPQALHHDVFRRNGLTYTLFNESVQFGGNSFTMDGVYIFDDTGTRVGEWHLFDHFVPQSWEGQWISGDYSHANAVWADAVGDIYVSFRHLSGFVKLDGDLASPDFGQITWRLSGDPNDPDLGSDFLLTTSVGGTADFERQHNVHVLPDGRIAMFDNRIGLQVMSRLLQLELDEVAMTADIVGAYNVPLHCDFQGGAWHTDAGNPMATCAPYHKVFEFDDGVFDPEVWSMDAECASGGFQNYIPRFVPLDW